jgi:molybdopterin-binding protein
MQRYTLREAADLLGVSVDTARRWAESGRLSSEADAQGRRTVEGTALAQFMVSQSDSRTSSMRNRFTGIVTKVVRGDVAAQVEVQSGPHRFVSLLTREAVDALDLHEGDLATAVIKATNVSVEVRS